MTLAFWRSAFALAVHASSAVARLVRATEARFYDACLREALTRPATESDLEAQRRSFAFGQVAMHDPTITRAQVDAIADTVPAPGAGWDCLVGGPELDFAAGEEHAAMVDLHGADVWPHSGDGRKGWVA